MQREMPVMCDVRLRVKQDAPAALVAQCRNYRDAVRLCIQLGPYSQDQMADLLGMTKGALNLIINRGGSEKRRRYLDPDLFEGIENLCANRAITQYFEMQSRGHLNRQNKAERIAAIKRELAQLEDVAA